MHVRPQHRASMLLLLLAVARVADVAAERSVVVASMRAAQLERLLGEQMQEAAQVFAGLEEDLRARHHHAGKRSKAAVRHHRHKAGGGRKGRGSAIAVDSRGHHRRHAVSPFGIASHIAGHVGNLAGQMVNVAQRVVGPGEEAKELPEKRLCCWKWDPKEGKIELHEYAATGNMTMEECTFRSDDECSQAWLDPVAAGYASARANASALYGGAKRRADGAHRAELAAAEAAKAAALAAARADEAAEGRRAGALRAEAERRAAADTEAAKTSADAAQKQAEATRENEKQEAQAAFDAAVAAAEEKEIAEKQQAQASFEAAVAQAAKNMEAARQQAENISARAASVRADGEDDAAKAYEAAERAAEEKMHSSMEEAKELHRAAKDQAKADVEAAIERNRRSMQRGGGASPTCSELQEAYEAKKDHLLKEVQRIEQRQNATHPGEPRKLGLVAAGRLGRAFLGVTKAEEAAKEADPEGSCGITASDHEELKDSMQGLHPCWPKVLETCGGQQGDSEEEKEEAFVRLTSMMLSCKEPSEEDIEAGRKAIEAQKGASEQTAKVEAEDVQAKAEAADGEELQLAEGDEGGPEEDADEAVEAAGSLLEQGTSSAGGAAVMAAAGSDMLARAEAQVEGAVSRLGQLLDSGADAEAESLARALLAGESRDGFEIFGLIVGGMAYAFALAVIGGAALVWFLLGWMVCILYKALSFLVNIVRQLFSWGSRPTSSSSIWGCYKGGFQSLSSWGEKSGCILMLSR